MPSDIKTKKSKNKKGKSGNPAVSSVASFKKTRGENAVMLPLPSGNVCRARRIGMRAFLESGSIPDYLSPIVDAVIRDKKSLPPEKQTEMMSDPVAILKTAELLDRATVLTVLEPAVTMPPGCAHGLSPINPEGCGRYPAFNDDDIHNPKSDKFLHHFATPMRSPEVLYADDVDEVDKTFIFQWSVGGGADLTLFREQYAESVEMLGALQASGSEA